MVLRSNSGRGDWQHQSVVKHGVPRFRAIAFAAVLFAQIILADSWSYEGIRHTSSEVRPARDAIALRNGLTGALSRRASIMRAHNGPVSSPSEGSAAQSADFPASWYGNKRVCFAWHSQGEVIFADFDYAGKLLGEPQFIGYGHWPRITGHGSRLAVVWTTTLGYGSVVRINEDNKWGKAINLSAPGAAIAFAPDNS